ncbi:MAG: hypothetical protein WEB04_07700 [Dehalococcoidia bacterium]
MKRLFTGLATMVLIASALLALVSCGDDDKDDSDPTATPQVTTEATSPAGETTTPGSTAPEPTTGGAFEGGQALVQGTLGFETPDATQQPTLVRVETAQHDGFDRIVFEFSGAGAPVYRVEYLTDPTDCGSGEPTFPSGGNAAYLQIKFMPAVAHNEAGASTIESQGLSPDLPSIKRARQSCDFEADVTWALLLGGQTDFRVFALVNPMRLAVDIAHP